MLAEPIIRGCIFDLDGVLVDTAKYHFQSWIKLSEYLDFDLDYSIEEQLKGIARMDSLNIVLDHAGIVKTESEKAELARIKNEWYLESLEQIDEAVVMPGVKEILVELSKAGIGIAVGSASKNATTILQKLGMTHHFTSIVDGNHVKHSKPHPEVFINAARDLQLPENQCLVFEDSHKGVTAALRGGFYVVGLGNRKILNQAHLVIDGLENESFSKIMANLNKELFHLAK